MIAGNVTVNGDSYVFCMKTNKSKTVYYLISHYCKDDLMNIAMGAPVSHPIIADASALTSLFTNDYLIEVIEYSVSSTAVKKYGNSNGIELILDAIQFAKTYSFSTTDIIQDETTNNLGTIGKVFNAADSRLKYYYKKLNDELTALSVNYGGIKLDLTECKNFNVKDVQLTEVLGAQSTRIQTANIKTITYEMLASVSDMSWYKENGVLKKDYRAITNKVDFEKYVITPLVKKILSEHANGCTADVGMDTETDGVFIYNLSKTNEHKSHCVTMQLSWEDNQGVIMFFDMEHFNNLDIAYAYSRLEPLLTRHADGADFEYTLCSDESSDVQKITAFGGSDTSSGSSVVTLNRSWYDVDGHNIMFDRRVAYDDGMDCWFNDDTLQMAFNLNTKSVRGNNKLKNLTRRFFGHETPELTDILGKHNEDKFRYLTDMEVACIYGCADSDYTRQLKRVLKALMPADMFYRYRQQDIKMLNVLAISEYYGMNTRHEEVLKLADESYDNIQILQNLVYSYVGAYVDYAQYMSVLDIALKSGSITQEEYDKRASEYVVDPKIKYVFEFKATEIRQVLYDIMKYPILAWTTGVKRLPKTDKYVIKKLLSKKRTPTCKARKLKKDVLVSGASRDEYEALLNGSKADKKKAASMVLVSAEEFNKLEYPLALLIQKWSSLNKEYTSYYKPIREKNLEQKMFYGYNMARIETRRIANPGQTMKGNLKALIRSYSDDYYMLDFDMSQAEYRVMVSLAKYTTLIERMKNPENDYHTETAAAVNNIPPHKVSKKLRKQTKPISFGIPYGLGERSLCENIFGEINDENLFATRMLIYKWKENNAPVMTLLEEARANALVEWQVNNDLRDFMDAWVVETDENGKAKTDSLGRLIYKLDEHGNKIPKPISKVENEYHFYRTFDLSSIDRSPAAIERRASGKFNGPEGVIRRAAGNYGIQSFAAELFRIILMRFYDACEAAGYHHGDKIIWHMLIHDELLASVHKSIHPFEIYKLVYRSCMISIPGHTNYFVGINIGDTWGQCKDDAKEAPVYFVDRMVKKWDAGEFTVEKTDPKYLKDGDPSKGYWFDDPFSFILPKLNQYKCDRIGEVVKGIQPDMESAPLNVRKIIDGFSNYTVRAFVSDYSSNGSYNKEDFRLGEKPNGEVMYDDDAIADAEWQCKFESWALEFFGEGKDIIGIDGKLKKLRKVSNVDAAPKMQIDEDDFADDFDESEELGELEDDYYDFDEDGVSYTYNAALYDESEPEAEEETYVIKEPKYKYVKKCNGQIVIRVDMEIILPELKKFLGLYKSGSGLSVVFKYRGKIEKWIKIKDSIDLFELDAFIEQLLQNNKTATNVNGLRYTNDGSIVVKVGNPLQQKKIITILKANAGNDRTVKVLNAFGEVIGSYGVNASLNLSLLQ